MDPFNLDMWNSLDLILPIHISVDWLDTDEAHIFKANLPGLKKEDVKVQVEEEHVLVISGEFKKDEVDKNDKWRRLERSHGTFSRRFCLPKNAMLDQVKANLTNGMLSVTIPKKQSQNQSRAVEVARAEVEGAWVVAGAYQQPEVVTILECSCHNLTSPLQARPFC
ncbi:16.9 kDa class I heat shock protein 1-like [Cryptomeria japonica]|uniref:16.9 kDa class I heat shock protein 1-like n=1 Tax=Cryptomeria japonica TaxID=3369 RepID=UPI0027DA4C3E|nr:16.9 kDa class I heat shock protein 1-like [Cryptomeria japonica]